MVWSFLRKNGRLYRLFKGVEKRKVLTNHCMSSERFSIGYYRLLLLIGCPSSLKRDDVEASSGESTVLSLLE
jgi:hypothetical protein